MASETGHGSTEPVVSSRTMDMVVAGVLAALGALVMYESVELGAGWAPDGPESGYFPFYIGLLMTLASLITLVTGLIGKAGNNDCFVERGQLRLVLQVLIPAAIFVAAIPWIGIYVAGGLFIAFFMGWLGRYRWPRILPVAVLVPLVLFVTFEIWFLISLPKGPLEAALGY